MSYQSPPPPPPPPPPPGGYGGAVPPPPGFGGAAGVPPNNYLVPAILATIFCCLPFGIVGIVFASQVNSKWSVGDVAGANDAAAKAKLWTYVSAGVGLAGVVLWFVFVVMLGTLSSTTG